MEGSEWVLWCECLQSVLWLQGCYNDPQPCQVPGTAGSYVFAMTTSHRCHEGEMLGSQSWALLLQHAWDLEGSVYLQVGRQHWMKAWGAMPWMKQQFWDEKYRNSIVSGQIQGLMPPTLPFSLPLSLQGCWWCSVALLPAGRWEGSLLGCREHPVSILACTNGRWKGKGSLTVPQAGRLLQAQLRSCRNTLHCFQQSD